MNKILKALDEKAEEWILIVMFTAVIIVVILQVFFRYVISASLGWSEELARYALIWITWISTSYAIKKQSHIQIELVKNLFSKRIQQFIELIVIILWFILAMFLAIEGTKLFMTIRSTGQVSPSTHTPMWLIYFAVPIGGALMSIRLIQEVYKLFKGNKLEGDTER